MQLYGKVTSEQSDICIKNWLTIYYDLFEAEITKKVSIIILLSKKSAVYLHK
jgi:hypothetical protein